MRFLAQKGQCYQNFRQGNFTNAGVNIQGWANRSVDEVYAEKRQRADNADASGQKFMYDMMVRNAQELHHATGGFAISRVGTQDDPNIIVDFCMAPGGFLNAALLANPGSHALAFTLPIEKGGHNVLLPQYDCVKIQYVDINLLAGDMGVAKVPSNHEESGQFHPRVLPKGEEFDLALCDGQVLRTHARAAYREQREAHRLLSVQLALGLEHLRDGGTMIVLLHGVDSWRSVLILHLFSKFSKVQLFKPSKAHTTSSSFYMIASDVKVLEAEAIKAVEEWKKVWIAATFLDDEDFQEAIKPGITEQDLLDEFGDTLMELGTKIWKIQGDALAQKDKRGWR